MAAPAGRSKAVAAPNMRRGDEDVVHREPASHSAPGQEGRGQALDPLADLHHALAVVVVGGVCPATKVSSSVGRNCTRPDHAQLEGAAGELVHLPADGYRDDLAREVREQAPEEIQQERRLRYSEGWAWDDTCAWFFFWCGAGDRLLVPPR